MFFKASNEGFPETTIRTWSAGDFVVAVETNAVTIRSQCPICKCGHKDADQPLWFFVKDDGYKPVCGCCIESHNPDLVRRVEEYNERFNRAEDLYTERVGW